jgi:plasmid stability protein
MVAIWFFVMATITIKDLPDTLHQELKEQAKKNDRSLNGEVISCLRLATATERARNGVDVEALLASIDRVRNSHDVRFNEELHARALSEGRP